MSLKVALVGCGKIADAHVEEIEKLDGLAAVVGVCDLERLMAEQVAVRYGISHYYDRYDRMLAELKPDVVHITTSPQSHLFLAKQALDAGCHVYVEKPLTLTAADTADLIAYAERRRRKLTVGYAYYFDPLAQEMRRLRDAGFLGEPVHVESFLGYNLAGPFGSAILGDANHWVHRLPGKLFQNNIDHVLNKVVEFFDADEIPRIQSSAIVRREARFGDARDEMPDELRAVLQGRRVSAYCTFSSHARPAGHFVRIYGTKNTLHLDLDKHLLISDSGPLPSALGRLVPAFKQALSCYRGGMKNLRSFRKGQFQFFAGMNELFRLFYRSILDDAAPPIAYNRIQRTADMMDAIFQQIHPSSALSETLSFPPSERTAGREAALA
jgi:predicted dehydrogenase